jgi:hypothetical protein
MNTRYLIFLAPLLAVSNLRADPALTIYNENFGVVRDTVPLELKVGVNDVSFADMTAHLEPDSVILRDPAGKADFQILEQNYRNDPVSQESLLYLFEGKTIDFLITETGKEDRTVKGKIIRSGFVPHSAQAVERYGNDFAVDSENAPQPVIEVEGKVVFGLPGKPLFPTLGDDTILKPALNWKIESQDTAKFDAEIAYVTGGMSWSADYNLAAPENGDVVDLIGWITMDNETGKSFDHATVKLMAGHVNKIQPQIMARGGLEMDAMKSAAPMAPPVTEKTFDEYHLYTVQHPVTLRDKETKQVEFIHATKVNAPKIYVYDGARFNGMIWDDMMGSGPNEEGQSGSESSTKVSVMREIKNSKENGLGVPLPAGKIRFYRQGDDRQLEFTGENTIEHTPKDETLRIYTGDAFDLVGERTQTNFHGSDSDANETYEIKVRNHKTEPMPTRSNFSWT